jgi:hypothetical protein
MDVIPGRWIVYIELDDFFLDTTSTFPPYFFIYSAGNYAIIESLIESIFANPPTKCTQFDSLTDYYVHPSCNIVFWSSIEQEDTSNLKKVDNTAKLFVVPTKNIVSAQIVVPYNLDNPDGPEQMIIAPMNTWMDAFVHEMQFKTTNPIGGTNPV